MTWFRTILNTKSNINVNIDLDINTISFYPLYSQATASSNGLAAYVA
jgi:hypothetical protein